MGIAMSVLPNQEDPFTHDNILTLTQLESLTRKENGLTREQRRKRYTCGKNFIANSAIRPFDIDNVPAKYELRQAIQKEYLVDSQLEALKKKIPVFKAASTVGVRNMLNQLLQSDDLYIKLHRITYNVESCATHHLELLPQEQSRLYEFIRSKFHFITDDQCFCALRVSRYDIESTAHYLIQDLYDCMQLQQFFLQIREKLRVYNENARENNEQYERTIANAAVAATTMQQQPTIVAAPNYTMKSNASLNSIGGNNASGISLADSTANSSTASTMFGATNAKNHKLPYIELPTFPLVARFYFSDAPYDPIFVVNSCCQLIEQVYIQSRHTRVLTLSRAYLVLRASGWKVSSATSYYLKDAQYYAILAPKLIKKYHQQFPQDLAVKYVHDCLKRTDFVLQEAESLYDREITRRERAVTTLKGMIAARGGSVTVSNRACALHLESTHWDYNIAVERFNNQSLLKIDQEGEAELLARQVKEKQRQMQVQLYAKNVLRQLRAHREKAQQIAQMKALANAAAEASDVNSQMFSPISALSQQPQQQQQQQQAKSPQPGKVPASIPEEPSPSSLSAQYMCTTTATPPHDPKASGLIVPQPNNQPQEQQQTPVTVVRPVVPPHIEELPPLDLGFDIPSFLLDLPDDLAIKKIIDLKEKAEKQKKKEEVVYDRDKIELFDDHSQDVVKDWDAFDLLPYEEQEVLLHQEASRHCSIYSMWQLEIHRMRDIEYKIFSDWATRNMPMSIDDPLFAGYQQAKDHQLEHLGEADAKADASTVVAAAAVAAAQSDADGAPAGLNDPTVALAEAEAAAAMSGKGLSFQVAEDDLEQVAKKKAKKMSLQNELLQQWMAGNTEDHQASHKKLKKRSENKQSMDSASESQSAASFTSLAFDDTSSVQTTTTTASSVMSTATTATAGAKFSKNNKRNGSNHNNNNIQQQQLQQCTSANSVEASSSSMIASSEFPDAAAAHQKQQPLQQIALNAVQSASSSSFAAATADNNAANISSSCFSVQAASTAGSSGVDSLEELGLKLEDPVVAAENYRAVAIPYEANTEVTKLFCLIGTKSRLSAGEINPDPQQYANTLIQAYQRSLTTASDHHNPFNPSQQHLLSPIVEADATIIFIHNDRSITPTQALFEHYGGKAYQQEFFSKMIAQMPQTGDVVITSGHNSCSKYVIHVIVPRSFHSAQQMVNVVNTALMTVKSFPEISGTSTPLRSVIVTSLHDCVENIPIFFSFHVVFALMRQYLDIIANRRVLDKFIFCLDDPGYWHVALRVGCMYFPPPRYDSIDIAALFDSLMWDERDKNTSHCEYIESITTYSHLEDKSLTTWYKTKLSNLGTFYRG